MKSQPGRGDGWRSSGGEREGGVQQSRSCRGSHPWVPPWDCCSPNLSMNPRGFAVSPSPAHSLAPSSVPSNVPTVLQAKESPFVPPEPSRECWSHVSPTGHPRLCRRFSSSYRSRAGGSCHPGGSDPAAAHSTAHSQTLTLFSF